MQKGQRILLCAVIGMCVRVYVVSGREEPSHGSYTVPVCGCVCVYVCVCVCVCVCVLTLLQWSVCPLLLLDVGACMKHIKKSNIYHEFFGSIPSELHKMFFFSFVCHDLW
jgi:hypothetical protein